MDEKEVQQILTEILCDAVNETGKNEVLKQKITPDILLSVYYLAKKHDLAHLISNFVYRNEIEIAPEFRQKLQLEEFMAAYRYEQTEYTFKEICSAFDEAKIPYIPLKGSVIRPYYPCGNMRTSCDIDILIYEDDLETAINCLKAIEYCCGEQNYRDVSLYSPNQIHLELHFNIQENKDNLDAVLKDVWEYAVLANNFQYRLSEAFFVFHIFAHMTYHFLSGGCGIRSLLDIWVMEHKMGITYTCAKDLLTRAGIYQFAAEISKLADRCFTLSDRDTFSDPILDYIFQGGVYGSIENHIAAKKSKYKTRTAYALNRLFLPYKSMMDVYPFLKKAPFLLPFCWTARWIKAVADGKSGRIALEMSYANHMTEEKIKEIEGIFSRLGL
ncbi:MAG: nucleotidyltransferase family protein [Clostridia bacterium]|nr:nucleotidyltransferase family protein [Clostridia bacterium]